MNTPNQNSIVVSFHRSVVRGGQPKEGRRPEIVRGVLSQDELCRVADAAVRRIFEPSPNHQVA